MISRLALFSVRELFGSRSSDYRILEGAGAASRNVSDFREDIELGLLDATAVLEHQILVVSLNCESGDHPLVRLAEEINAHIKAERIVFDHRRVYCRGQIVELDLRRPAQVGIKLQARKRAIRLAEGIRISKRIHVRHPISFARKAHLFGHRQPGVGNHQESIFLVGVASDAIFATAGRIDELNFYSRTDAGEIAIEPALERISGGRSAALGWLALVRAAGRMAVFLVGLSVHDVDAAAIGLPAGNAGSEMLVRIGDSFVVLLAIFIFVGVGIGIATAPEVFDEAFAFLVRLQFLKRFSFVIGNDVSDVLFEPILIGLFQFRLDVARFLGRVLTLGITLGFLRQASRHGKDQN